MDKASTITKYLYYLLLKRSVYDESDMQSLQKKMELQRKVQILCDLPTMPEQSESDLAIVTNGRKHSEQDKERRKLAARAYRKTERYKIYYAIYCYKNKNHIRERKNLWRLKNKDKIKTYSRRNWLNNKEHIRSYMKRYGQIHREELNEKNNRWRAEEKNVERCREYFRKHYLKNKNAILIKNKAYFKTPAGRFCQMLRNHRRRSKEKKIVHAFTSIQWQNKVARTDGICPSCQKKVGLSKLTVDHTPPLSKAKAGTIYSIADVQPLCISCNSSKYNK